jgi:glycosyltransferase involved in cell wall biosynthesis
MTVEESAVCSAARRCGWPWEGATPNPGALSAATNNVPKITVITPSYNQCEYIEATILSVLHQNYPNIEYIVLDGGSTDGSIDIIKKYESRIRYWHSKSDNGQADALATGFDMATGEIYCWLNSDDIFLPNVLTYIGMQFVRSTKVDVVYGNRLLINSGGEITGSHAWPYVLTRHHWYLGQPLAQECCFWRREIYEKVGGVDREKFFIMDYDLFYRMWLVGKFAKTKRFLGCLRIHDKSKGAEHRQVWKEELAKARVEFDLHPPSRVTRKVLSRFDQLQGMYDRFSQRHWNSLSISDF